jgi:excisionase family DNA binding protein
MSKYKITNIESTDIETITLDATELAKMLNVSKATVYAGVRTNEIPHFRVRNKILFNKSIILAWTRGEIDPPNEAANA